VLRQPRLFLFVPAWISIFAVLGIWLSTQLTYLLSVKHRMGGQMLMGSLNGPGGATKLSLVMGVIILFFGLCLIFWAYFLNRFPRIFLMLCAVGGIFLCCLALERLNHLSVREHFVQGWWFMLLLTGIFAMSAFAPAALSYLAEMSEGASKDRGLLMGLYSDFLGVGQIIGNSLGGFFAQTWGFDGLVDLTVMLAVVAVVALLALHRYERREVSVV
jgi:MFS family permease